MSVVMEVRKSGHREMASRRCLWSPKCTKYYTMEEHQQDFQPIVVGKGRDLVGRKNTSTDDGPYAQQTSYHEDKVTNVAELP